MHQTMQMTQMHDPLFGGMGGYQQATAQAAPVSHSFPAAQQMSQQSMTDAGPVAVPNSGNPWPVDQSSAAPHQQMTQDSHMGQMDAQRQQMNNSAGLPQVVANNGNAWPYDCTVEEKYEQEKIIGVGVYGTVYRAKEKATGKIVAVKKLKIEEDYGHGVPASVIREVVCLRDFTHPNIVEFIDIHITGSQDYSLIFEFVEGDLHQMLKGYRTNGTTMPMNLVKKYSLELLSGILACHNRLIIHRDLKPQNILVGRSGLKIGDFGLARMFSLPIRNYTLDVITLWYRAPEILLGTHTYGKEVDMWSTGCIIAEMATGKATFPGDSEIGTIFQIFKVVGTPSPDSWPALRHLDHWKESFPKYPPTDLQGIYSLCPRLGPDGLDLLRNLLSLNPQTRMKARRAKESPFVQKKDDEHDMEGQGEFGGA
jgi:serine/threonine protein kinase